MQHKSATQAPVEGAPGERLPFVSVIMPIRNEAGFIEKSLGAVLEQDYPAGRMEILVSDGRSTDGTRERVEGMRKAGSNLSLVDNPEGIVSTGLNRALQHARGDVIIRVDGHTIIDRDYVSECVAALQRSGADNVGGPMRAEGAGRFGGAVAAATSSAFGVGGARFHYSDREEWVDTVYMGAWRRVTFEKIGAFDESMVRNQDDEFNYRLLDRGGRILLTPKIRSRYSVRSSPGAFCRQYFQYGVWKLRVMLKHPRQIRLRHLVPPTFVATLIASIAAGWIFAPIRWLAPAIVLSYMSLVLGASIVTARTTSWRLIPFLALVYPLLHLSYGLGVLTGVARSVLRGGGLGRQRPPVSEP